MTSAIDKASLVWMAAAQQPIGLGVVVSDPLRAKTQLYQARKKLTQQGVPELDTFTIRTSPEQPACHLWVLRTAMPPTNGPPMDVAA